MFEYENMQTKRILNLSLLRCVCVCVFVYENWQIVQKIVHDEGHNLAYGVRLQDSFYNKLEI